MARFRLQWQQCLRETSRTAAQLTDLLFQFNAAARDEASGDTNTNTMTNYLWNTNTNTTHLNDNEDESSGDLPDAGHDADGRDGQTSRDSKCHRHWESTLLFQENPQKMRRGLIFRENGEKNREKMRSCYQGRQPHILPLFQSSATRAPRWKIMIRSLWQSHIKPANRSVSNLILMARWL